MKKWILVVLVIFITFSCELKPKNISLSGQVFGTSYSIKYYSDDHSDFQKQFDSIFYAINKSMSTYQVNSVISKLNRNEDNEVDLHFRNVLEASKKIYNETQGAFDPTIGAVVNAWSFGPEGRIVNLDSLKIDSLMMSVGLNKVSLIDNEIIKENPNTYLDFNAIAKGYAVDVIGEFLETKNIENYLVEIGGEIRAKGDNMEKEKVWRVGVEMPHFDGSQSIIRAIALHNASMATSGTYRKFKIDEHGNKYSHIIDTKTGYPSKTNLLSISVIANNCMIADAYATAFKTMGIDRIKDFLKSHPELKVFLIFDDENKELVTLSLNGFPEK
ncbi:MAG: FAD:protein FMN transferase [Flavobacteriaceae bacterium]